MKDRIKELLNLKYPTRQDMRECMWLQKEYIDELEQKLDIVQQQLYNADCVYLQNVVRKGVENEMV